MVQGTDRRQSLSSDDQTMCAVGFMNDITEEKERMLNLEKEAAVDSFTGLMIRRP